MSRSVYVETSALLRVILEGDEDLRPALLGERRYTSALTLLEATRAILRARLAARLDPGGWHQARRRLAEFGSSCEIVPLHEEVLRRAGEEFPVEPLRTLDAIHLATLGVLGEALGELEVVSCDQRVRENAAALGFSLAPR